MERLRDYLKSINELIDQEDADELINLFKKNDHEGFANTARKVESYLGTSIALDLMGFIGFEDSPGEYLRNENEDFLNELGRIVNGLREFENFAMDMTRTKVDKSIDELKELLGSMVGLEDSSEINNYGVKALDVLVELKDYLTEEGYETFGFNKLWQHLTTALRSVKVNDFLIELADLKKLNDIERVNDLEQKLLQYKLAGDDELTDMINRDLASTWLDLGAKAFNSGDSEKAIDYCKRGLEIDPENHKLLHNLGTIYEEAKDFNNALKMFEKLKEINPNPIDLNLLAKVYFEKGNKEKAYELLNKIIDMNPQDDKILGNIGNMYAVKGNSLKAIEYWKKSLEKEDDAQVARNIAITYRKIKDYDNAILFFNKLIDKNPENKADLEQLGLLYGDKGDLVNGKKYLNRILELDPNDFFAWANLGNIHHNNDLFEEAIPYYKKALSINSDDDETWYFIGACYYGVNNFDNAIDSWEKVISINPDNPRTIHNLAVAHVKKEDYEGSIKYFKKMIEIDPSTDYYNDLAGVYYKIDKIDEAIKYSKKAFDINPNESRTVQLLGTFYSDKEDWGNAIDFLERAHKLEPNNKSIMIKLGGVYRYVGELDKSFELAKKSFLNKD